METPTFSKYRHTEITLALLDAAAKLFSTHYGIWGQQASAHNLNLTPGSPIKMSPSYLQSQVLASSQSAYITATLDNELVGHACACRWKCNGKTVCWITQLVVHRKYRERGLATRLLIEVKEEGDEIYGIASSHAGACRAAARAFGSRIAEVDLEFIRGHAGDITGSSPVRYIRNGSLHGSLFDSEVNDDTISSIDTAFFVDRAEPLQALQRAQQDSIWPLGELKVGHEFLLLFEAAGIP